MVPSIALLVLTTALPDAASAWRDERRPRGRLDIGGHHDNLPGGGGEEIQKKENKPHMISAMWYSTIQRCSFQIQEMHTKADIHKDAAHLLREGTASAKLSIRPESAVEFRWKIQGDSWQECVDETSYETTAEDL
ncbi:hypothetical protein Anapl_11619 [Anas platyrhynchos]|uniref:Uncharacterized protein n=1 Tax=Anas platyrhynchos TaxID=8839 RepID=R0KRA5_ANAPL|nr:hypothetical protein Anapl_11619 [Anas platyrhynchos]